MKLLFYISTICNGGAARVMSNLANTLSRRGYDCTLATTFRAIDEYVLDDGVKRYSFYDRKPTGNWLLKNLSITRKLHNLVVREKPDLLVSFLVEPNYRAALATIGTATKTVLSVRNDPNWEFRGRVRTLLAKFLYRRADGVVFQTEEAKAWFPQCIQDKSCIIFNAVKEEFYEVELSENRSGIVATGRLSRQKNHSLLVRAYAKIADQTEDDLTIYGAGDTSQLQDLAQNLGVASRVHFPGQTMDVKKAIKGAKVYVMSSDFEGMPNALMEAMAMGLPCISTDCPCGGPHALFKDNMYHFLTPVGDDDTMAERMLELLNDPMLRKEHGQRCKDAAKNFAPEIINRQWEEYLLSVVKH